MDFPRLAAVREQLDPEILGVVSSRSVASMVSLLVVAMHPCAASAQSAWSVGSYQVPDSCPKQTEFVAEVLARCLPVQRPYALTILHGSSVNVHFDSSSVVGSLRLPSGQSRNVVGSSCSEVEQALALVVALQAKNEPGAPATHDPELTLPAPTSSPPTPAPVADVPPAPVIAWQRPTLTMRPTSSVRVARRALSLMAPRPSTAHWAFGIGGTVMTGPAPEALFGGAAFIDYWVRSRPAYGLTIALEATANQTHTVNQASADFRFYGSQLDACLDPFRLRRSSQVWLCVEGLVGAALVEGRRGGPITQARLVPLFWYSMGPAVRLAWSLPGRWRAEIGVGAGVPFVRHVTKFSAPDITAYETFPLAGSLSIRIGYQAGGSDANRAAIAK